jgi:antitoxin component YwqK of YwqJK toxin-antitoxin module
VRFLLHIYLFLLITKISYCQNDTTTERKFYNNGKLKHVVYKRGIDTIELIRFYKNGNMRDSIWLHTPEKKEFPFGTEREYFPNGKLSCTTMYGPAMGQQRSRYYNDKGALMAVINRPAGVSVFYTTKGEIRQVLDENKEEQIYVPLPYRGRQHLIRNGNIVRVKSRRATLLSGKKRITLSSGALISCIIHKDTLHHCKVEGFSKDSIIFSKFEYDLTPGHGKLMFDSTFAVAKNTLSGFFYAKHNTHKRARGGKFSLIAGISVMCLPAVMIPLAPRTLFSPAGPLVIFAVPVTLACLGIGFPLYLMSKQLYKTMIPKKYDMEEWTFRP